MKITQVAFLVLIIAVSAVFAGDFDATVKLLRATGDKHTSLPTIKKGFNSFADWLNAQKKADYPAADTFNTNYAAAKDDAARNNLITEALTTNAASVVLLIKAWAKPSDEFTKFKKDSKHELVKDPYKSLYTNGFAQISNVVAADLGFVNDFITTARTADKFEMETQQVRFITAMPSTHSSVVDASKAIDVKNQSSFEAGMLYEIFKVHNKSKAVYPTLDTKDDNQITESKVNEEMKKFNAATKVIGGSKLPTWAIALIVVGSIIGVAVIVALIFVFVRKH